MVSYGKDAGAPGTRGGVRLGDRITLDGDTHIQLSIFENQIFAFGGANEFATYITCICRT